MPVSALPLRCCAFPCLAHPNQPLRDTVLALGGSKPPAEVFKMFRGRDPSTEALLRHAGLTPVAAA